MDKYKYGAIVISGVAGAGKDTLIGRIMKETGWSVHQIGNLFRAKLKNLQEKGEVDKNLTIQKWWPTVSDDEQRKVNRELLELVNKGKIIADTRFAFYLKEATSNPLFIFLTADLRKRAERATKFYPGESYENIEKILQDREDKEVKIGKHLFNKDYRNINDYHIAINSGLYTVDEEVDIIMNLMKK